MIRKQIKPVLAIVAGLCMGFYLGGRYVGALAKPKTVGLTPATTTTQPAWLSTAQSTIWLVLGMGIVCVALWIGLDYMENHD